MFLLKLPVLASPMINRVCSQEVIVYYFDITGLLCPFQGSIVLKNILFTPGRFALSSAEAKPVSGGNMLTIQPNV